MKSLQIELKDLHEYRVNEAVLFARGKSYNGITKELRCTLYGAMQVWQDGKIFREFTEELPAVECFNEL